ncbi:hypothetical protein [Acidianus manzaensis]|uniref:hypothetical protein n=1 Tax=Acidianus manzaensis TaxID=282676 RepID=UPI00164FA4BD|nr:hypothetical protein [Acidianus manzaensis]
MKSIKGSIKLPEKFANANDIVIIDDKTFFIIPKDFSPNLSKTIQYDLKIRREKRMINK